MNLLSGRPWWPIKEGLPVAYPCLGDSVRCDVAVIGGGVTGALVALHLAEAGIDTVVVDRREAAHGSTAGSTSLLQYEIDEPLHRLSQQLGVPAAQRAYEDCRQAIRSIERLVCRLRIDCAFERRASVFLARDRSHLPRLEREFAARRAAGIPVEWWSRSRLRRESTLPHPAAIVSAHGEAAQLDAYRFTYGLLEAARRAGARVFDRTEVTERRLGPRRVELTTRAGPRIRARWLVVAAGYEADTFLPECVTALHSTYALVSEPVERFAGWPADEALLWETSDPYVYLRTTPDRRVILGGYDEPFRDPRRRDALLPAKTTALVRRFRQLLPRIELTVAHAWTGTFARTKDGLPFIGRHPAVPSTWFALGYGGNGITYSLIAAEALRDFLLGRGDADEELYGFHRADCG